MHAFYAGGDKHFSAGDINIENMHSKFSKLPGTSKQDLCQAHP